MNDTAIQIVTDSSALEALNRSEIDTLVATAKRYPRSISAALREAEQLATLDHETASSCYYVLPRAGKKIEGPSVRLAEIVASSWGNVSCASRIVSIDATQVVAQGICVDLEKNNRQSCEVRRRITDSKGRRYAEDMIAVTCNAAASIALRNAIFKVIPAALVHQVYLRAREASVAGGSTMTEKRDAALAWYRTQGVKDADVLELLDRRGVEDITIEDLITLRGIYTAIRDGDTTLAAALKPKSQAVTGLAEKLAAVGREDSDRPTYGDAGAP